MLSDPTTYVSLLYLALVTAVGLVVALQPRERGLSEYFIAGRGTGSIALALSIGVTTLGAVGIALLINPDLRGQVPALIALSVLLALLIVLGVVVGPRYLASRVMTAPELIARRFGRLAGSALGIVSVLLIALIRLPMILLGGGWALSQLTGWEPLTTAMLILVVAGLYATAGGLPSVVITQAMQGATVILSVIVLLTLSLVDEPLVIGLSVAGAAPLPPVSVAMMVISLAIVSLWYFWADHFVVQRVLSVRSHEDARRGVLLASAFIAVVALLGLSIIGIGTLTDESHRPGTLPLMMGSLLVLSLTVANVAGMLQSAAAMIALDIVRPVRKTARDNSVVLAGRLSTTGVAVVVLLLVSALGPLDPNGLLRFLDAHLAVAPPAAALFIGALFVRRTTAQGALAAMFVGVVLGLAFMGLPPAWNLPGMTFAVVSFLLSLTALFAVSYLSTDRVRAEAREPVSPDVASGHADAVVSR